MSPESKPSNAMGAGLLFQSLSLHSLPCARLTAAAAVRVSDSNSALAKAPLHSMRKIVRGAMTKRDRIDSLSRHPLSTIQRVPFAPLYTCKNCGLQYYDGPRVATGRPSHLTPVGPKRSPAVGSPGRDNLPRNRKIAL